MKSQFLFCSQNLFVEVSSVVRNAVLMYHFPVWAQHMVAYLEKRWFSSQHGWIVVVQILALQQSERSITERRLLTTDDLAASSETIGQSPLVHLDLLCEINRTRVCRES